MTSDSVIVTRDFVDVFCQFYIEMHKYIKKPNVEPFGNPGCSAALVRGAGYYFSRSRPQFEQTPSVSSSSENTGGAAIQ